MPKLVNHDERRIQIAEAVLRVVAREGVRGVTIRDIAAEADWSIGVITHYFDDKQALLVAALAQATARVRARMEEASVITDPKKRICALLEAGMPLDPARTATCRIFFYFWAEGAVDKAVRAELARGYVWWRVAVRKAIEAARTEGLFPSLPADALTEMLVGVAEGLGVQGMFDAKAMPPEHLRVRLRQMVGHLAGEATSQ